MTLYEQIKNNFILPNAYNDWKAYRQILSQYIIDESNQVMLPLTFRANTDPDHLLPSLAILGAGPCNDIDLHKLISHFSKITLMDYDTNAMQKALETYRLKDCPYIECKNISFTGFDDFHYEYFCNSLQAYIRYNQKHMTITDFEDYALSLLEDFLKDMKDNITQLEQEEYDYICCIGLHSQLYSMFAYIYHAFDINLRQQLFTNATESSSRFTKRLTQEIEHFIPRFHDALLTCAKQSVFLGLEEQRTDNPEAIEGAHQAIADIKRRALTTKATTMTWPFLPSEDICYKMLLLKINTYE